MYIRTSPYVKAIANESSTTSVSLIDCTFFDQRHRPQAPGGEIPGKIPCIF